MSTVISDETGAQVEVVQVEATASVAAINSLASEFPKSAAADIERAMVRAVQDANERGETDPDKIREAMLQARHEMKNALRMRMNDLRSQPSDQE